MRFANIPGAENQMILHAPFLFSFISLLVFVVTSCLGREGEAKGGGYDGCLVSLSATFM
jgi:hypothetical protein